MVRKNVPVVISPCTKNTPAKRNGAASFVIIARKNINGHYTKNRNGNNAELRYKIYSFLSCKPGTAVL